MKTTVLVDEGGRLVLPKPVRKAIGISGRTRVSIEIVSGKAELTPVKRSVGTGACRPQRAVDTGALPSGWDSGEALSRMRQRGQRE